MIPPARSDGQLPAGIHEADNWAQFEQRFGTTARRRALLVKLRRGLENLRAAGCEQVLLDGSFVSNKPDPSDVDGCWEYTPRIDLSVIDIAFVRLSAVRLSAGDRARLKALYGMDFFIGDLIEGASGEPFSSFFQQDRAGNPKGVVRLALNRL